MFKNLAAEQARHKYTDEYVSRKLDISRATYSVKKTKGTFTLPEVRILLEMFNVSFDYLFATDDTDKTA